MLMWAVWRLKKRVIQRLLDLGTNVHFYNVYGESVSTYWKMDEGSSVDKQKLACEIIDLLHEKQVPLNIDSQFSYSIVRRARENKLNILLVKLQSLGY